MQASLAGETDPVQQGRLPSVNGQELSTGPLIRTPPAQAAQAGSVSLARPATPHRQPLEGAAAVLEAQNQAEQGSTGAPAVTCPVDPNTTASASPVEVLKSAVMDSELAIAQNEAAPQPPPQVATESMQDDKRASNASQTQRPQVSVPGQVRAVPGVANTRLNFPSLHKYLGKLGQGYDEAVQELQTAKPGTPASRYAFAKVKHFLRAASVDFPLHPARRRTSPSQPPLPGQPPLPSQPMPLDQPPPPSQPPPPLSTAPSPSIMSDAAPPAPAGSASQASAGVHALSESGQPEVLDKEGGPHKLLPRQQLSAPAPPPHPSSGPAQPAQLSISTAGEAVTLGGVPGPPPVPPPEGQGPGVVPVACPVPPPQPPSEPYPWVFCRPVALPKHIPPQLQSLRIHPFQLQPPMRPTPPRPPALPPPTPLPASKQSTSAGSVLVPMQTRPPARAEVIPGVGFAMPLMQPGPAAIAGAVTGPGLQGGTGRGLAAAVDAADGEGEWQLHRPPQSLAADNAQIGEQQQRQTKVTGGTRSVGRALRATPPVLSPPTTQDLAGQDVAIALQRAQPGPAPASQPMPVQSMPPSRLGPTSSARPAVPGGAQHTGHTRPMTVESPAGPAWPAPRPAPASGAARLPLPQPADPANANAVAYARIAAKHILAPRVTQIEVPGSAVAVSPSGLASNGTQVAAAGASRAASHVLPSGRESAAQLATSKELEEVVPAATLPGKHARAAQGIAIVLSSVQERKVSYCPTFLMLNIGHAPSAVVAWMLLRPTS